MKPLITTTINTFKRTLLASATVALLATSGLAFAPQADAAVFISVNFAPPPLPIYEQPEIPEAGYMWTPGYWAYDDYDGYYWVPGTWVQAPYVGALWTPGYWGWSNGAYVFYEGYWADQVGYYGGINYGFGYCGEGYQGGYWNNGGFYYNVEVNRIENVRITNIYNRTVINNVTINHYSFNGPGGVNRRPTTQELAVARERHFAPVSEQVGQEQSASHNRALRAAVNHGAPPITATAHAGEVERATESVRTAPKVVQSSEVRSILDKPANQEKSTNARIEQPRPLAVSVYNERLMPDAAYAQPRQPMREDVGVAEPRRVAPVLSQEPRRAASVYTQATRPNLAVHIAPSRPAAEPRVEPHGSGKPQDEHYRRG